jgi:hypothetical protein
MPVAAQVRTDPAIAADRRAALLDEWVALGEQIAALEGRRIEVLAERAELLAYETGPEVTYSSMAQRSMVAEFAAAGHVSPLTMEHQFSVAAALVRDYPRTLTALRDGRISRRHAEVILDAAPHGLEEAADGGTTLRAAFEHDVLPFACESAPARTRTHARGVTAALQPVTLEQAHREAREEREVTVRPTSDGMAQLIAVIPEVLALGIHERLGAMSRALRDADAGDDRTTAQRRADILCDLLLSAAPSTVTTTDLEAFRPVVHVTLAASTLVGWDNRMAEFDDAGPLHPDIARRLAGNAPSFTRLFLDPSGMVTNVDSYVPTSRMKRYLRARDQHCRFPGCRSKVERCELDHNLDRAFDGPTSLDNLADLCSRHHPLKHPDVDERHRWTVRQEQEGELVWTSPLGRQYVDAPHPRVMFV